MLFEAGAGGLMKMFEGFARRTHAAKHHRRRCAVLSGVCERCLSIYADTVCNFRMTFYTMKVLGYKPTPEDVVDGLIRATFARPVDPDTPTMPPPNKY